MHSICTSELTSSSSKNLFILTNKVFSDEERKKERENQTNIGLILLFELLFKKYWYFTE
jgi:hypothetical protein